MLLCWHSTVSTGDGSSPAAAHTLLLQLCCAILIIHTICCHFDLFSLYFLVVLTLTIASRGYVCVFWKLLFVLLLLFRVCTMDDDVKSCDYTLFCFDITSSNSCSVLLPEKVTYWLYIIQINRFEFVCSKASAFYKLFVLIVRCSKVEVKIWRPFENLLFIFLLTIKI